MLRTLWFFFVVSILSFLLGWLADRPGSVSLYWEGYKVDTSVFILLSSFLIVLFLALLFHRIWLFFWRIPTKAISAWENRKRGRGYKAFTKGMVSVAAGEPDEALRQVKRVKALLSEIPLTMLLAAQTAQLSGDEKAASEFFVAMTRNHETEFLGLKGLITQSIKDKNIEKALELVTRAHKLKPKSEWVARSLFTLQVKKTQWVEAQKTSKHLVKISKASKRAKADDEVTLAYQVGLDALREKNYEEALQQFKSAIKIDPSFVPAVQALAIQLKTKGKIQKAQRMIESAWKIKPHPQLLDSYWEVAGVVDKLKRVSMSKKLLKIKPDHPESLVSVVRTSLDAKLWGEARRHLELVSSHYHEDIDSRMCRFWAQLEKEEKGDVEKTLFWLARASQANSPETWVCNSCRNVVEIWAVVCQNCDEFNTFRWQFPPRRNKEDILNLTHQT